MRRAAALLRWRTLIGWSDVAAAVDVSGGEMDMFGCARRKRTRVYLREISGRHTYIYR